MEAGDTNPDGVLSLYRKPKNNQANRNAPEKIRCFIGGEWKPRLEFSGRQLDKFDRSRARPGGSQISCRAHSAQVRRELLCEGPCAKWHPIENFSRSTRSHSKTWCMDCTEWQLSVEPGFAPYIPPRSFDEVEDDEPAEDDDTDIAPADEVPGERIEDWIQGNPSELGDYDRVETGTRSSVVGGASDISGPSLLDSRNHELGGLPEALNAANLGRIENLGAMRPSYASVASTVRGPTAFGPQGIRTSLGTPGMPYANQNDMSMSDARSVSQSNHTCSSTLHSTATTTKTTNQSQSDVSGTSTTWMENEFSALAISQQRPSQRVETSSGWARPVQRKTDLVAPRYVASNGGVDIQPQNFQKAVYADADDDDSEDEC